MKFVIHIFLFSLLLFSGCKKKKDTSEPASEPGPAPVSLLPACETLPLPPEPFGWKDSSISDDKNVNAFFYNPQKNDEIVYTVNGDVFTQNKMYLYTITGQLRHYLSNTGNYPAQLNTGGWLVFNRPDNNIYKIKINGDSLTQLTTNYLCCDPKWDFTNRFFYCFQAASGSAGSYLLKLNAQGQLIISYPVEYANSVPFKNSNNLLYLKTVNNKIGVFKWNFPTGTETLVIQSNKILNGSQNDFFNLNIDNKDENVYWTNETGLMRINLNSLQTDTILKNCPNYTFLNPVISANSEEVTFTCRILKPLSTTVMYREYRSFELNLLTKEWRELKLFAN